MKLRELGEFGLLALIEKLAGSQEGVVRGIGDDCAVLPFNKKKFLLLTNDMLVEDVDFTLGDKPYSIGHKSMGCCLSDIAACGGIARYSQVSLGLPSHMSVENVKQLYRGIISLAEEFGVKVVGGDISRSKKLIIDMIILGMVERQNLVLRKGAKKRDIIFVSGKLGGSIYGRHLKFNPRIDEDRYLVKK